MSPSRQAVPFKTSCFGWLTLINQENTSPRLYTPELTSHVDPFTTKGHGSFSVSSLSLKLLDHAPLGHQVVYRYLVT